MRYKIESEGDKDIVYFTLMCPHTGQEYTTALTISRLGLECVRNQKLTPEELGVWLEYVQNFLSPHYLISGTCISTNGENLLLLDTEYKFGAPEYFDDLRLGASLSSFVFGLGVRGKSNDQ